MGKGKHVTLTITERCNLNCVYCYEEFKSNKVMEFETAVAIIDKELKEHDEFEYIEIAFHGGEPLLEFDLLKRICEWTWSRNYNVRYYFFATTNGVLLDDDMKSWFMDNSQRIMLGLSLDGNRDVQNYNRSDSYDDIHFEFFKKTWPSQPVKMTISDYTLDRLADSIIHIHELGFKISANFAFGMDWKSANLDKLDEELNKIAEYYIKKPELEVCSLIGQRFDLIDSTYQRWCGAGVSMKVYDTEGHLFPCHYFMDFAIGKEKAKASNRIDFNNDQDFVDAGCKDCALLPLCPTCYGYNYASTGSISKRDQALCVLTQHCIAAGSYIAYFRLQNYSNEVLNITEQKRNEINKGIFLSQKYLQEISN